MTHHMNQLVFLFSVTVSTPMMSAGLLASSGISCTTFDTVVISLLHTFTELSGHITYKAIYKTLNSFICSPMHNPEDNTIINDDSCRGRRFMLIILLGALL